MRPVSQTIGSSDPDRWALIQRAPLPAAPYQSFAARLAVLERLSIEEADGIVTEYRRFLYLAAIADSPRVPAELVGLAWQLHATHDDYLEEFCPAFIGRPLPYIPGIEFRSDFLGPQYGVELDEIDRDIAYRRTRLDYAVEFGQSPNKIFWPMASDRPPIIAASLSFMAVFVASFVLSALMSDVRVMTAGVGLASVAFMLLLYRTRDSRGWRPGAGGAFERNI